MAAKNYSEELRDQRIMLDQQINGAQSAALWFKVAIAVLGSLAAIMIGLKPLIEKYQHCGSRHHLLRHRWHAVECQRLRRSTGAHASVSANPWLNCSSSTGASETTSLQRQIYVLLAKTRISKRLVLGSSGSRKLRTRPCRVLQSLET